MHPDTLKYYYDRWDTLNSCFAYRGPFQDKLTNTILDISEQSRDHQQPGLSRKVSFMLVECFQNILKHSESFGEGELPFDDDGMFSFKYTDSSFVINSINILRNKDVPNLVSLIEQVNALDEKQLKKFYLEHLENNSLSAKGGAGLGLIELSRKSGQKILYKIFELDKTYSQFHQQITLSHHVKDSIEPVHFIVDSDEYYNLIRKENIFLQYKGDFTQKSILPILEMTELRYKEEKEEKSKALKAKHVLIEILQNMGKARNFALSPLHNPILILGQDDHHLYVSAGNVVSLSEKMLLEEKLEYLLSLEEEELAQLHRTTIRASLRFENKDRTGLGLIEVVRSGTEKVKYQFYPINDNNFLFALCIKF